MPKSKDPNLHHVSVQAAPVVLHKDIKEKISEIRVKRDALMIAHNKVNLEQDKYNKAIICLSLFAAFFESTKAQLDLSIRNDWLGPTSTLMPILLSTILSIISSLMKFKKFNERIDLLSKATEKSNATVLNLRRLEESLNFQSYLQSYKDYSGPVTESYRDALDCYERALYPQEHDKYLKEAIKLAKNSKKYENQNEKNLDRFLHSKCYPNNIQLDSPDIENSQNEVVKETQNDNIKINVQEEEEKDKSIMNETENIKTEEINDKDKQIKKETKKVDEMSSNMNELYKKFEKEPEDKQKLTPKF